MPELPTPLAVVCHDAGATQLILPWIDPDAGPLRALMAGPAARLWEQRFGSRGRVATLDEALDGAALLLSGTGWASNLEHAARMEALARGVRSVAVVDHWVNYAARFQRDGHRVLPDEMWVTDAEALMLARSLFPGQELRLQPNLYLRHTVERIRPCPDPQHHQQVLYVLEPMQSDWGRGEAGEFQALDYFVAHAARLGLRRSMSLRLRPHPSDPTGKYDAWIERQRGLDVSLDLSPSLADALDDCAWVAGCETMAMVVALAAGRRVVCTLPPWAPACRLPQRGLVHLKALVAAGPR